jgi:PadR family transcriptional regulator AphA
VAGVGGPDEVGLTTGEWAVLGLLASGPIHGFALAKKLQADGALGRVWSLRAPLVYRALQSLVLKRLATVSGEERSELGPQRRLFEITGAGRARLDRWLEQPVRHTRDVRSQLMLKLALGSLLQRDMTALVAAQKKQLLPQLGGLERQVADADGFARDLAIWRVEAVRGVLRFLDRVEEPDQGPAPEGSSPGESARESSAGERRRRHSSKSASVRSLGG